MTYVADTNVLLRWLQQETPDGVIARNAVAHLWSQGETIYITPQNVIEFWNVATRPESANGLGYTPAELDPLAKNLETLFPLLPDSPAIYETWRNLVVKHQVSGVQVHDTRLAAALIVHNMSRLLTFNVRDFARFGVEAIDPKDVL